MNVFRLFATFFRIGAMNELQYRLNFFIQLLQSCIAVATGLIGLGLVFSHTNNLGGWSQPELQVVMGVHILIGGIVQAFIQPNMQRITEDIQEGTFDFVLTKPVDAQALASVREIKIWRIIDIVIGAVIVISGVLQGTASVHVGDGLLFVVALLLGVTMIYSFWLILTAVAFWVVRVDQMINLFEGVFAAGRWPVTIYPGWLRGLLTFLMPVAFAVTVPATTLTDRLTWPNLAGAAGLALGFFLLGRWIWRLGLRNYAGASA